ncbi:putative chorismate mutase [Fusobacterium gonidiaformans 3-1-5R]|uniref:Putative chorismate mutase n=2 Tax=Fusobacterium TaxID=848 RepID=E5BF70_9FUSO|nr:MULTISPECIES: chorismate mutase [Fusobacterium]AVQ16990.1 chorismate mutase [Fusobacterium gonidiaformans ATCC 25563]EFS20751.1 putative chorismate mutase [Fusobacterium gonidiaformans 3-1-5R]KXA14345.1 putative chorismate mutase [Fusobacterium equinum]
MDKLEEYRKQMSEIDQKIASLFLTRMDLSIQIGNYKKEKNIPIYQEEREKIVLENIKKLTLKKKEQEYLEDFFLYLMSKSKEVQK